jgi:putative ABC transport system permease protein
MLRNYLLIAYRDLLRHKVFSLINITGLALGLTCSLLIGLWVADELQIDGFHANKDRIYRVLENTRSDTGEIITGQVTAGPLAGVLKAEVPEVEQVARVTHNQQLLFSVGEKKSKENGLYADPGFWQMFSFRLREGIPHTVFASPDGIVISERLAQKYFAGRNAVGETILITKGDNETEPFRITGIVEDVPANSSFQFDFLLPFASWEKSHPWLKEWGTTAIQTYVLLHPQAPAEGVEEKIKPLAVKHYPEWKKDLALHRFDQLHLYSKFENGKPAGGRIEYVRLFSVVAVFVLLIACINFMNLATARSSTRTKEVGVRKVIGANKGALIRQFMGEALLMALLAMLLANTLTQLALPHFNQLTGKSLQVPYGQPVFLACLLGLTLLTALLSGSYPAFFLSSFRPIEVLKGTLKSKPGSTFLRQGLVVFQFSLCLLLIIGTLTVYRQVAYIMGKNLGFDRENLVYLKLEGDLFQNYEAFKQDLAQFPSVKNMTLFGPGGMLLRQGDLPTSGVGYRAGAEEKSARLGVIFTDYDFVSTLGAELIAGRNFSREFATDTGSFLINEAAARQMGLRDPVGQTIDFWGQEGKIIGVIKDFHSQSLHSPIKPLLVGLMPENTGFVLVRTQPGQTAEALQQLEAAHLKHNPRYPFEYEFLDETFAQQYRSEQLVGQLTWYFALLTIFVACLGLYGLAAFTAEQRTKEIGIRKVLGASVASIVGLLSKDFVRPVGLAILLASPLAWYAGHRWLQHFAFRTDLGWWLFAVAGAGALAIAVLTVGFQAMRAAKANPVRSLRSE